MILTGESHESVMELKNQTKTANRFGPYKASPKSTSPTYLVDAAELELGLLRRNAVQHEVSLGVV